MQGPYAYTKYLVMTLYVMLRCRITIKMENKITTLQSALLTYFRTPLMLCVLILYISGGTTV